MKSGMTGIYGLWFILLLLLHAANGNAASFYVDSITGDDSLSGTNPESALRSLAAVNRIRLAPGDSIFLAAGRTFKGEMALENVHGTAAKPVLISTYLPHNHPFGDWALIDARGCVAGVCLKNCSEIEVRNLQITANGGGMQPGQIVNSDLRCGVLVEINSPGVFSGFVFSNLLVKDIFYENPGFVRDISEIRTANGTQDYGWGIRFINFNDHSVLRRISIVDCEIQNVSHTGLQFSSPSGCLRDVKVSDVRVTSSGGPGVQMSGLDNGVFSQLDVNDSGSSRDPRDRKRGSGLWTWTCDGVIIENSRFQNAHGPGDSCGVHIDYNCRNVIIQDNLSVHNAGGFCEILGNDHHCAYRYNVSVDDGYRTKGVDGAFQEGKILWLSGYVGDKKSQQGPFETYFYNNTIYTSPDLTAKISISPTTRGLLIANNIFCIEGKCSQVEGDQTAHDANQARRAENVVFENNLFLHPENWPPGLLIKDGAPIIGNPEFKRAGGTNLEDYLPSNIYLVRGRGIPIPSIPGDKIGLKGGLQMDRDAMNQTVKGIPCLGALEYGNNFQTAATHY